MLKKSCVGFLLILMAAVLVGATPAMAAQEKATATQEQPTQAGTEKAVASSGKVNICTASAAELEKLPGIGASTAQEIVKYREQNGPFTSAEELKKVKGIGDKRFETLKDKITVQ